MKRQNSFVRELFLLFYLLFFCATFLYKLSHISILHYLVCIAEVVYIPGMFFAAGYDIYSLHKIKQDLKDFRGAVLRKSFIWLLHYYIIGFLKEYFLDHRAVFATIKDLLALNRMPGISAIFISLCMIYLMAAFLWIPIVESKYHKWIIPALCFAGFLLTFLPEGIIGYSLVGIFAGKDLFGAVPIFPYLFSIFLGAFFGKSEEDGFQYNNKKFFALIIGMLIVGSGLYIVHFKTSSFTLLGSLVAGVGITICYLFNFIYQIVEGFCYGTAMKVIQAIRDFYNKKQKKRGFRTFFYIAGYTVLFIVVAFFIFIPYKESGRTLIWSIDGLGQYVPKIHRFMRYIPHIAKDVLHGNMDFQQYDFTSGLGSVVAFSFDPIYWLYLLFNPSQIETVYSAMVILRFFLAGLSMSALILFFEGSYISAYTGSMIYAFSGYAIYAGTKHAQFITPLILLPMLVVAMERLIRDKKWYMMTIFAALSLLCSYYFLWMNTIAIGIYFILRILCTKEYRNFKTFFTRGLIIVGSYILGSSMGIISLFTQFASYMGSSRTEGTSLSSFLSSSVLFYRQEWIPDYFISFISDSFTPGMWLKLGFAPLALFAIILLFTRKNRKELRLLFVISTLFCIFPIFGFIFSGFSSVNNRWCFIYTCLIAFIAAKGFDYFDKLTHTELKIMTAMTFLYGGIVYFSTKYRTDVIFSAFGLLTVTLLAIYLVNQKNLTLPRKYVKYFLSAVVMITIILNANAFISPEAHLATYVKKGTSERSIKSGALKYLSEVTNDNEEFYRATNLRTSGNNRSSSLLVGYNDLSTFSSTLGSSIVDYNSAMGNCDWNIVSVYSYNTRVIMNELASVKYVGIASFNSSACVPYGYKKVFEKTENKVTRTIYKNELALPLGYTYDNILSSEEASKYSAAEKQDLTMMTAIVDSKTYDHNTNLDSTKKLQLSAHKLEITDYDTSGNITVDEKTGTITAEEGSSITFYFDGEENSESYLSFKGDIYHEKDSKEHFIKTQVSAENSSFEYKFRIDSYATGQEEFLFHLGYHEDAIDSCKLTFKEPGTLKYDEICCYSQPMDHYEENVAALKENSLTNVKTEDNYVSGDIEVDSDKMLCISLPYQKGWTAYVDGEKTEIQRVNYQYMGLNLTPGKHKIELRFRLIGIQYAFLITLGGLGVFLLIIIFNCVRKRIKSKNE